MRVQAETPQQATTEWAALLEGTDDVHPGEVAAPRQVSVSMELLERVRAAVGSVLGDAEVRSSIADVCPDPLVFALESGLPRLMSLERSIDGGSQWTDLAPMGDGPLFAVSAITEVAERMTADKHLIRVVYRTQFTNQCGALVGTATGTSLHVGSLL